MEGYEACLKGWEIKDILGQGTFGKVVQACKVKDDCDYAIKIVRLDDEDHVDMFERESEINASLSAIGVAPKLYEVFKCDQPTGTFGIFISEKFDMDLLTYLRPQKAHISLEDFSEVDRLVEKMHKEGFAHLDLKDTNVMVKMVGSKPKIRLIDFGFAVSIGDDIPFDSLDESDMVDYYGQLYGRYFTKENHKMFYEGMKKTDYGIPWDPSFVDDMYVNDLRSRLIR